MSQKDEKLKTLLKELFQLVPAALTIQLCPSARSESETAAVTTLDDREPESTPSEVRRIAATSPQRVAAAASNGGTPRQMKRIPPGALIHRTDSKYNPTGRRRSRPATGDDETNQTRSPMPIDPMNESTPTRAGIRSTLASGLRSPARRL
ncbi:MAG: hypothetical protein M5U32_00245 [Myxococcota bacterium]|nr:hypothetical protein [Myxococcota bacterium]